MKIVVGDGQYVIYAKDVQDARQVVQKELQRVDEIKGKIANLLSKDGVAYKNFAENTAEENLNIHFNDATSLIYDDPNNATTKGEVKQRTNENGKTTYNLAYRYPNIEGHNADFRLAHEMGHLVLNPSNDNRQVYNKASNSRQVAGLIRRDESNGQFYGMQIQENAINLIAQLAIRGNEKADDIMLGKVDLSEYNSYKRCDDLVKLIAVSMRNDFDKEMSFEQLAEQKIDSMITRPDGTQIPANTFFYGIVNDSSMVENEFDKYLGKGAWRDLDEAFKQMYNPNISQEKFEQIYQNAQGLVQEFANIRYQDKYQEAVKMNGGFNIPSLENKMQMLQEIMGRENESERKTAQVIDISNRHEPQIQEEYSINEFGEIIRPNGATSNIIQEENIPTFTPPVSEINQEQPNLSIKQRIAQFLQKNNLFMNLQFVERFVNNQLNLLPPAQQQVQTSSQHISRTKEDFINQLTGFGKYQILDTRLPHAQRMSDPEKIANMKKKMEQHQQANDEYER